MTKKEWYFYIGAFVIGIGFLIYYNEVNVYVDQVLFLTLAFAPLFIFMFVFTIYVKMDSKVLIAPQLKATLHGGALFDESNEKTDNPTPKGRGAYIGYALEGVNSHGISIPEGGGMGGYIVFPKRFQMNFLGQIVANVHLQDFIGKNEHDKIDEDIISRFRNHKHWKEDCCVYVGEFPYYVLDGEEKQGVVKYSPTAKELSQQKSLETKNITIAQQDKAIQNAEDRNATIIKQYKDAMESGMIERKGIPSIFRKDEDIGRRREA